MESVYYYFCAGILDQRLVNEMVLIQNCGCFMLMLQSVRFNLYKLGLYDACSEGIFIWL